MRGRVRGEEDGDADDWGRQEGGAVADDTVVRNFCWIVGKDLGDFGCWSVGHLEIGTAINQQCFHKLPVGATPIASSSTTRGGVTIPHPF